MPVPNVKLDYLRKPWIDRRDVLIDMLCSMHGTCYRDMKKYRSLQ